MRRETPTDGDARQEFELALGEGKALADLSADCLRMIRNALPYAGDPHTAYLAATWEATPLPRDTFKAPCSGWREISTAPKMQTILLFAVTDIDKNGVVKNWKMATGSWRVGYDDERSKAEGKTPWEWDGHIVRVYEIHPTHWMPLPAPPGETR